MASAAGVQPGVKSALRTLDLIEFVVACPSGVVAQEIAAALAIPMSSLSYLLATLVERGYLRREGRQYFPGEGLDRLRVASSDYSLIESVRPIIRNLRVQFNETTSLFVLTGWEVEAVLTETGGQALRYAIEVGTRAPLHCVAGGKAILATLPDDMLERYFAESRRERFTERTVCERAPLMAEIEKVRKAGVAVARDEFNDGLTAFGHALQPEDGLPAAISIAVPTLRVTPEREAQIVAALRKSAKLLRPAGTAAIA